MTTVQISYYLLQKGRDMLLHMPRPGEKFILHFILHFDVDVATTRINTLSNFVIFNTKITAQNG